MLDALDIIPQGGIFLRSSTGYLSSFGIRILGFVGYCWQTTLNSFDHLADLL